MPNWYVQYDVKGIQQFIFSVPKLKYIVGASAMIHEYDTDRAPAAAQKEGIERLFSGGGRGAFQCNNQTLADELELKLVEMAHSLGLDVRVGVGESLSGDSLDAPELHPYVPESLEGEPCSVSALWPVPEEQGQDVHPIIEQRREAARLDALGSQIMRELQDHDDFPDGLSDEELQFMKQVTTDPDDDTYSPAEGEAGQASLGGRNRWAIVAMDGNDIGKQFRAFVRADHPETQYQQWLRSMSQSLRECTRRAFIAALAELVGDWWANVEEPDRVRNADGRIILPFRPLILGGDDLLCLCHCSYAVDFTRTLAEEFTAATRRAASENEDIDLWPGTGGVLTISAGIAFTNTSYPLASSIPYAESLLENAKRQYRRSPGGNPQPTPAAVDWEHLTENLIDSPERRRGRSLRFSDKQLGTTIELTRRPYRFGDLDDLRELAKGLADVPASVRADILPNLRQPWSHRVRWLASMAKRTGNQILVEELDETNPENPSGRSWEVDGDHRRNRLPDALLLLKEQHRMGQNTTTSGATDHV